MKYLVCMGIIIVGFLIITMILAIYCSVKMNKTQNGEDILLYDQDKVTLDDCIIMDKCYGKKAVINDGEVLGFKQE